MKYKFLYLPSKDQTLYDGCTLIDSEGRHFTYDKVVHYDIPADAYRIAEPWLVSFRYNEMKKEGRPDDISMKWLTTGMEVKAIDCSITGQRITDEECDYVISVKCPMCQDALFTALRQHYTQPDGLRQFMFVDEVHVMD